MTATEREGLTGRATRYQIETAFKGLEIDFSHIAFNHLPWSVGVHAAQDIMVVAQRFAAPLVVFNNDFWNEASLRKSDTKAASASEQFD
jgi:hypothetical protein